MKRCGWASLSSLMVLSMTFAVGCGSEADAGGRGNEEPAARASSPLVLSGGVIDQSNFPGLGAIADTVTTRVFFDPYDHWPGSHWLQPFVAGRTGPLLAVGAAIDTTGMCVSFPKSHMTVHVVDLAESTWSGGRRAYTDLDATTLPCSTWAGGQAGLQTVPMANQPLLTAGSTYAIYYTDDTGYEGTAELPAPYDVIVTLEDGYTGGGLRFANDEDGAIDAPFISFQNFVFVTFMGDAWGLVNDTDPNIVYEGQGWSYFGSRPTSFDDVQNDLHGTLNEGDAVSYTFTGTGVSYISELSDGYGVFNVYLDGQLQQTLSANAPGTGDPNDEVSYSALSNSGGHTLFAASNLPRGPHTIRLVNLSGAYMLLDAFVTVP